ncbi:MAG TPA: chloride channel protein [Bacteroidota bacterium]|nr:chloride channel protein [Bacteroidota bacterium]
MKNITIKLLNILRYFKLNKEVTNSLLTSIPLWIASFIVGGAAVLYAKVFAWAEAAGIGLFAARPLLLFFVTPACFVISWMIVHKYAPFARGSGIPQVSAALELPTTDQEKISRLMGLRVIVVKIISTIILIFGGGAIGREGPTIQIAGSIFRTVGKYLPNRLPKNSEQLMILTGSAAGLAAAFNTPLGGIVFAIEELSKSHFTSFRATLITSVIIAGITAQMILGPYLYLGYPVVSANAALTLTWLVLLVAVSAGACGAVFSMLVLWIIGMRKRMKTSWVQMASVAGMGMLIAFFGYFASPAVLGSGKDSMIALLFASEKVPDVLLAPARFLGPLLSFSCGAAGGVFAPALSSGAAIGATIAHYFPQSPEQTNILILAGMVSFLTAVTRSPFTSSILVLEMTDRHAIIFFLMFAGLMSYGAAWLIDTRSLYDRLKEMYLEEVNAA